MRDVITDGANFKAFMADASFWLTRVVEAPMVRVSGNIWPSDRPVDQVRDNARVEIESGTVMTDPGNPREAEDLPGFFRLWQEARCSPVS